MKGSLRALAVALAFACLAVAAVGACDTGSGPSRDPSAELRAAGQAMGALKSVTADVRFGPGTTYQGYTLDSASARIALPGGSDTTLKVKQNDFLVDVRVVTVDGHAYVKVPFGKFSEVTPAQASELPDMGRLFDRQQGLPAILGAGLQATRSGTERIDGIDCDRITTTYSAEQVGQVLNGLKPAGDIKATLWISPADHLVRRVALTGSLVPGGPASTVRIDLHDFNAPMTIVQPTP